MNAVVRVIVKLILTIIVLMFFGGVFRGCSTAAQTGIGRGIGLLFATIIFVGALYGIWSYPPNKKNINKDITLKKD
jgi:hypothetical protein